MKFYPKLLYLFLCSFIFTGCNPTDSAVNNQTSQPAANSNQTNAASAGQAANVPQTEDTKFNIPKDKDIDLQTNHPNGTVLRVSKVSFANDSISIDFAVTNGYKYEIELAQGGMQLRDNLGNVYNLSPPPQDPDISVAPNNNLKGKLTFLGRIAPNADSLNLTTNYKYGSRDNEYARTPTMVINNIPVER